MYALPVTKVLLLYFGIQISFGLVSEPSGSHSQSVFIRKRIEAPPPTPLPQAVSAASADSLIFLEKQALIRPCSTVTDRALTLAHSFLGAPYVTGTLDAHETEQLVLNLRQLDCWTLVENCTAIALTGPQGTFADYRRHLRELRYWGGTINGYASRQHYFTGWVLQAEKNGILKDLTKEMGGIPFQKKIAYISLHAARYPKLKTPAQKKAIADVEARITRHPWHYIPKSKIKTMEHQIQAGDIVLLASSKAGLDLAHEGFAVRRNGKIHLLHASSIGHKVLISSQPLATYVHSQKGMSGIMVIRFKPNT